MHTVSGRGLAFSPGSPVPLLGGKADHFYLCTWPAGAWQVRYINPCVTWDPQSVQAQLTVHFTCPVVWTALISTLYRVLRCRLASWFRNDTTDCWCVVLWIKGLITLTLGNLFFWSGNNKFVQRFHDNIPSYWKNQWIILITCESSWRFATHSGYFRHYKKKQKKTPSDLPTPSFWTVLYGTHHFLGLVGNTINSHLLLVLENVQSYHHFELNQTEAPPL